MIFSGGDPQIRTYKVGIFRQVLDIQGITVLVDVVLAENGNAAGDKLISSIFNIHEDLAPFCQAMEKDRIMTSLSASCAG